MLLGQTRTDPQTGQKGIVRTIRKRCATCITPAGRLFRWPMSAAEYKRIAGRRYRWRA